VTDRFAGGVWEARVTGAPVLTGAVGSLDCRVVHAHAGGEHTISSRHSRPPPTGSWSSTIRSPSYDGEEHAIAMANDDELGLGASVWSGPPHTPGEHPG
jgi:hypothetical protein